MMKKILQLLFLTCIGILVTVMVILLVLKIGGHFRN
jgi:hypothetical protein